ncbi:FMN-dependent oxidoreductase (nitrilotriacetate monooxygenase family) [Saccharothrix tamanrassetensis]|uniref:FMN-dependent oxidoreductase (Nitrilotriacetate monooxygenase family) n=1 Tax=Saccharothrix tamanrassetensis TaxID=1051531 RepID=A0A841CAA8_9PSEU|nr:LLM class flavin-dependent oxidoreductase [Saccharothrix tamanrassetensis]MBB5953910.1 FMN-dependent oxidoreductase (nitrilotriacetate monooxygenase family) [Saccharothrix tamanrassetensis]
MLERQLHLNAFLMGVGHHEAAWRHPRTDPGLVADVGHFQRLAAIAERGAFDSVFLADGVQLWGDVRHSVAGAFEPLTLLTALACVTDHIGLIATASTGFTEPYNLARWFSSLDHISGGRAGWNIVTTAGDRSAQNFNLDVNVEHHERYQRAAEFVDVVTALWDSWDQDALVLDAASGVFADPDKVREINHRGRFFRVRGPLNAVRSPQGRPLLVQAGSSEDGRAFAAAHAEAVFTAQQTVEEAREFYQDLKTRVAARGRAPDQVVVLPGIVPVLGSTAEEARRLAEELDDLIVPARAVGRLSELLGVDLTGHPLDEPVPPLPPVDRVNGARSRFRLIRDLAAREALTLRQLLRRLGGGRGHKVVVGTPEVVADHVETWFRGGAADGFNVMPPLLPSGLEEFVDHVVPLLRRRGLFRSGYTGRTLREHYGLTEPRNRFPLSV